MSKKVALITGAGAGLGKKLALKLASNGFDIAINDINDKALAEAEEEIKQLGVDCLSLKADVSDNVQVKSMFDQLIGKYGRIDVLVNNAGICPIEDILEVTPESFERAMNINFISMYTCAHYAIPHMIKQGWGRIINAGSTASFTQTPIQLGYCTSKWAIRGLTRNLASALAKYNITVNAYCPGAMDTAMQEHILAEGSKLANMPLDAYTKAKVARIPIGRWIMEEEVASFVSYLASEEAAAITGQSILIDGGTIMN